MEPVRTSRYAAFLLAAIALSASAGASAQDAPVILPQDASASGVEEPAAQPSPQTIGGMPEMASYQYTSPVKKLGINLGLGSYAVSALFGLIYLVSVYPVQALFGSSTVEPVMLWLLVPIAGPWMAQYEDLVKDKPVWRGVLIADAGLQAVGLVLGLVGAALSGRRADTQEETSRLELKLGVTGVSLTFRTL